MVELLTHLLGMQHAAQIDAAQKAAGHGGVHSLDGVGQLVDMALPDGGAVGQCGIVQDGIDIIGGIGRQNDVVGIPVQHLLIGDLGPIGVLNTGGGVETAGVLDHIVLVHGGAGGLQHRAVAGHVDGGGLGIADGLVQAEQVVLDRGLQLLTAGNGVGGLSQQVDGTVQFVLILRLDGQHGQAQFLHLGDGILQLGGHDDKVGGQRGTALKVKLLGGADAGQALQLGCGEAVDRALVGLGLDADQLVLHAEGDEQAGGDVVAAGQRLGLGLDGDLAAQLVGDGQRVGDGGLGGGFNGGLLGAGGDLGCSGGGGGGLAAYGGGAAAGGQRHGGGQQQGGHFGHFHGSFSLMQ